MAAPTFDREKLLSIKPDVILIFDPKGQPLGDIDADSRLADFKGLEIPAVTQGRIVLIDDAGAMLPSSRIDRIAATLAKAIHPGLEAKLDEVVAASMSQLSRQDDIEAMQQLSGDELPAVPPGSVTTQPQATPLPPTQEQPQ